MPAIFISYRRNDTRWFAATLLARLTQHLPNVDVFLDVANIEPGLDFESVLARTLDQSEVLLALIGKGWLIAQDQVGRRRLDLESDWVRIEIARALDRNIRVIPVLVDDADMPSAESLPTPLAGLSRRQMCSVRFEEQEEGITRILKILSKVCEVSPADSTRETLTTLPQVQPSATSVLSIFEEGSTDNETLTVLAEHQLDSGRFGIARAIFELIKARMFRLLNGPPEIDTLRAMYQVGRAKLLQGESEAAASDFDHILPYIERERDESYPLYIRTQAALARAHLECGRVNAAQDVLPLSRGIIFRDQSLAAVDAWIAHAQGRTSDRDDLMAQLDKELASFPPTIEFGRSVSRLRETMLSSSSTPTMIWRPDKI
ncbi:MAG TPA: toll/interleukin-1 receptor domain-containing protein [Pyrinomonadaceae bacterium]|nr:toll/interleukin-1 receptor domain-containing protein [Pyrinomonadaceae bacterium]